MAPDFSPSNADLTLQTVQDLTNSLSVPVRSDGQDSPSSEFKNDKYQSFNAQCEAQQHNWFKVSTMCPATQEVIDKMRQKSAVLVRETAQMYAERVQPYLDSLPRAEWIDNVISKKAEAERLILEDEDEEIGFVLHPDIKWSGSVSSLYCLAICKRRDIKSIRDLTAEHIPLLKNIRDKCCAEIRRRWNIPQNKLRLFLHYQPSYYHLHVHIVNVDANTTAGFEADRAHLLDQVIDNLQLCWDYYQRATLQYKLVEGSPLWPLVVQKDETTLEQQ